MRIALLALTLLATWWSSAYSATVPVVDVDRGAVGITNGTTDFLPFATTTVTYTISNDGTMPLAINRVTISGDVGATIGITTAPTSPIAAGGSTTLVLSINPDGGATSWSFKVNFGTTDLVNNPFSWTVKSGTPVPEIGVTYHGVDLPDGSVGAASVEVGAASFYPISYSNYTFVVSNTGTAPLTITDITAGGESGDANATLSVVNPISFPATVNPGATLSVIINVVAQPLQNWRGTVTIFNNDGTLSPLSPERNYQFTITGTYEPDPEPTTSGTGEVRLSGPTGVILINGDIARTPAGSSQAGVATDYTLTIWNMSRQGPLRVLYPIVNASTTPPTFGPAITILPKSITEPGPINATATIPNATPSGTTAFNPAGTIANNLDTGWVTIAAWPYPNPPNTLSFTVRVTPTKEGNWTIPVRFRTSDFIGVQGEEPYTIYLKGTAIGVPDSSVSNRGDTDTTSFTVAPTSPIASAVGFTNTHSLVVRNTGTGTLLLADTLVASGLTNCTVVGTPSVSATSIGPGSTATYTVQTTPTALGLWSASFQITTNDPTPSPFVVTITDTADPPAPELDIYQAGTLVLDGGTAVTSRSIVGKTNSYTFALQNSGTQTLTITGASAVGTLNASAAITAPAAFPATVAAVDPSTSIPLTVTVNPPAKGPWSVDVTVLSDDGNENPYTFTFTGTAVKLKPQDDCGIGTGFSFLLLLLVGGLVPLVRRRR